MPMSDQVDPDLAANSQWRQPDSGPPQQEHHKHHLPHLHDDHPDPIMHQPPASALATPGLPTISERPQPRPRPDKTEGRRWTGYNIFTLWANDVHSLGNYGFALGLFALGLGGW